MVIPSLMMKIRRGDSPVVVWGDGTAVRDFAFSEDVAKLTPAALARKIDKMETQMVEHAKNLEFEEAARLRDQVTQIKQLAFIS